VGDTGFNPSKKRKKERKEGKKEGRKEKEGGRGKVWVRWYTLVIPATREAEVGESCSKVGPSKNVRPYQKTN
jgi:hypothetical protein